MYPFLLDNLFVANLGVRTYDLTLYKLIFVKLWDLKFKLQIRFPRVSKYAIDVFFFHQSTEQHYM